MSCRRIMLAGGRVAFLLTLLEPPLPAASQFPTEDLSVREVLTPRLLEPGGFSNFSAAMPLGDVDQNGQADFLFYEGMFDAQGNRPRARVGWSLGAAGDADLSRIYGDFPGRSIASTFHRSVFLKRGQEYFVYWADTSAQRSGLWDLATSDYSGSAPFPPTTFKHFVNLGDQNQDGYDELGVLAQSLGPNLWVRLFDGKSGALLWERTFPGEMYHFQPLTTAGVRQADYDGDGFPDLLTSSTVQGTDIRVRVLSGQDGSVILDYLSRLDYGTSWHGIAGLDTTGDDIPELTLLYYPEFSSSWSVNGGVRHYDGATGTLLWETPWADIRRAGPMWNRFIGYEIGVQSATGGVGGHEVVFFFAEEKKNGTVRSGLVTIDAGTGDIVRAGWLPHDLGPWTDLLFEYERKLDTSPVPIGDWDRDGYVEYAINPHVYLGPGTYQLFNSMFVIIGPRTLKLPSEIPPGGSATLEVDLPSAAGMPFNLIWSNRFSREKGYTIGGWRTCLLDTSVLRNSLARRMGGTLDGHGQGSLPFHVPANSSLTGLDFYFRAIVPHPTIPGDLQTQSSLETLKIR